MARVRQRDRLDRARLGNVVRHQIEPALCTFYTAYTAVERPTAAGARG